MELLATRNMAVVVAGWDVEAALVGTSAPLESYEQLFKSVAATLWILRVLILTKLEGLVSSTQILQIASPILERRSSNCSGQTFERDKLRHLCLTSLNLEHPACDRIFPFSLTIISRLPSLKVTWFTWIMNHWKRILKLETIIFRAFAVSFREGLWLFSLRQIGVSPGELPVSSIDEDRCILPWADVSRESMFAVFCLEKGGN